MPTMKAWLTDATQGRMAQIVLIVTSASLQYGMKYVSDC